jgi:aspartate/methionine/tyrosine aminotransferase
VSARVSRLRPTAVNSVLAEVRRLREHGRPIYSLMRGEPDLATPAHIVEAAAKSLRAGRTAYPDNRGEPALREAIAAKLAREHALTYDPATEVLVAGGATFGLYAALAAVLDEGDQVLLPEPIYDAYHSPIRLAGGVVRSVPAEVRDGRFGLSEAALRSAWTPRCKALLLNTPWNPTGTVLTGDELAAAGRVAVEKNLVLISDEIYEAIVYDGRRHVSIASLSADLRARTIVVNSLSKTYAMTGWRVGWCAGPAAYIDAMYLILQQSSRGPATFVQDAAAAALTGPQECVEQMRAEYARRRGQVVAALSGLPGVRVSPPEGGFFAMPDVRGLDRPSDEIRRRLLNEFGVVVIHGSAYGPAGEGTLRVSFAAGGEALSKGLEQLRRGLEQIARGRG